MIRRIGSLGVIALLISTRVAVGDPVGLLSCLLNATDEEAVTMCIKTHNSVQHLTELFARGLDVPLEKLPKQVLTQIAPNFSRPNASQNRKLKASFETLNEDHRLLWLSLLAYQSAIEINPYFVATEPKALMRLEASDLARVLARVDWRKVSSTDLAPLAAHTAALSSDEHLKLQWIVAAAELIRVRELLSQISDDIIPTSGCVGGVIVGLVGCGASAGLVSATGMGWVVFPAVAATIFASFGAFLLPTNHFVVEKAGNAFALLAQLAEASMQLPLREEPAFARAYADLADYFVQFLQKVGSDRFSEVGLTHAVDGFLKLRERLSLTREDEATVTKLETLRKAMKTAAAPKQLPAPTICQALVAQGALVGTEKPANVPEL